MDAPAPAPLRHRRAGLVALFALLANVTALFLPWWALTFESDGIAQPYLDLGLFSGGEDVAYPNAIRLTLALAAVAVPVLLVRVAATSWQHEWRKWRRDLLVCAGAQGAAMVSVLLWPAEFSSFWGGQTRMSADTGQLYTIAYGPGLGWWCMAAALLLVGLAWWMSRPEESES